jgi:hypothetical protein
MEMLDKNDPVQMKVKNAYDKAIAEGAGSSKPVDVCDHGIPLTHTCGLCNYELGNVERGKQYDTFLEHASITQKLKAVIYAHPSVRNLQPYHLEALDMIVHKIGGIVSGNPDFKDSWNDIADYATLVSKIIDGNGI